MCDSFRVVGVWAADRWRRGLTWFAALATGKALSENSDGIVFRSRPAICGVLGPQNTYEYASVLRPCIRPACPKIRPRRVFRQSLSRVSPSGSVFGVVLGNG